MTKYLTPQRQIESIQRTIDARMFEKHWSEILHHIACGSSLRKLVDEYFGYGYIYPFMTWINSHQKRKEQYNDANKAYAETCMYEIEEIAETVPEDPCSLAKAKLMIEAKKTRMKFSNKKRFGDSRSDEADHDEQVNVKQALENAREAYANIIPLQRRHRRP